MKKKDVKKIIDSEYKKDLQKLEFVQKGNRFIKKSINSIYEFSYVIYDYGNVFTPEFSYGISLLSYNSLISLIMEQELSPFAYYVRQGTLYEMGIYSVDDYLITSEDEVFEMTKEVMTFFHQKGLPFLESITDIKKLDNFINQRVETPSDGVKNLIIAKLSDNPNYEYLKKKYREIFKAQNWSIKEDIVNFEKVCSFLDPYDSEDLNRIIKK
ncbi:hypothetical protein [Aquimarina agarilytica]|uniref:hypothetical protein n=1 Tax=Aquimarina agarilytica TaxID=1087449 RepID=UPI000288F51F|nr:hypothetical protein [Aquimarina agarilytica]